MLLLRILCCHLNASIILLTTILLKDIKVPYAANAIVYGQHKFLNFTIITLLKDLKQQHNYNNIVLMHNKNTTIASSFYENINNTIRSFKTEDGESATFVDLILSGNIDSHTTLQCAGHLMQQLQLPIMQLNELQSVRLKLLLGEHVLTILQIDVTAEGLRQTLDQHRELLLKLRQNLLDMSTSHLVLLINDSDTAYDADTVVEKLLSELWRLRFLNVIAVRNNYQTSKLFYRFNPFPTFQLEAVQISVNRSVQMEIYPVRLNDLMGYKIPTIIGGTDPRIIPYYNAAGQLIIGGYVGHYISTFAHKYNCSYHQPIPYNPNRTKGNLEILPAVKNGSVEWSTGIMYYQVERSSYPYDHIDSCVMIPVEADVPSFKFFTLVFKDETYLLVICSLVVISMVLSAALRIHGYKPDLLDIVCHDDCLRGLLGQPFPGIANAPAIVSALYLEICFLGIVLTTSYNGYFSTYVTKSPKETPLSTFDDAQAKGLKIIFWTEEYIDLMKFFPQFEKYSSMFILESSLQKFLKQRDSMNTKFAYTLPTSKWIIVNEQQKKFTTPLFKQPPGFCFIHNNIQSFPINENSIFKALHHQLILETHRAGLLNHWKEYGFLELIKAKKIHMSDLSASSHFSAMKVQDFKYIFIFLGIMLVTVLIVFIAELLMFYRRRIFIKISHWRDTVT